MLLIYGFFILTHSVDMDRWSFYIVNEISANLSSMNLVLFI